MSVNQRITLFLQKEGAMPVSAQTGLSKSALYKNIKQGGMSAEALGLIFQHYPYLNISWFFTGVGEMLLEKSGIEKSGETVLFSEAAEPYPEYEIAKVFEPHVGDVQGSGCAMSADGSCLFRSVTKLNETTKENEELKRRLAVLERQVKRKK